MLKRRLLIGLLALTFLFVGTALVLHYSQMPARHRIQFRAANLPVTNNDGKVASVSADAENSGIKVGDRIESVEGEAIVADTDWAKVLQGLQPDRRVNMVLVRNSPSGDEKYAVTLETRAAERDFGFYAGIVTSFLYSYALPTIQIRSRSSVLWGFSTVA